METLKEWTKGVFSQGKYNRNTSFIPPDWEYIRNADTNELGETQETLQKDLLNEKKTKY